MTVHDGDLGLALFDDRFVQDPYPLYAHMLAEAPVHRVGDSGFHAVCSWDAVTEALARPEDFSSNLTGTMSYRPGGIVEVFPMDGLGGPTQVLATADDPTHAWHRKLLVPQLAAKRIHALEGFVIETIDRLWRHGRVEWMSAVGDRLPMMVVCRLLGVPVEDTDQLASWAYASTQFLGGLVGQDGLESAGTAAVQLSGYIAGKLQEATANPPDNLLGDLASACAAGELDMMTAQMIMVTLFGAGGESTASLIGSATDILATRPHLQNTLRENPDLAPAFLEEVLRLEPPFRGHYRHVRNDCSLGGQDLAAGSRLLLLWGAANRDPAHFDAPGDFRLNRPGGKAHLSFGRGAHFCVGAALARLEARIVVDHLLRHTTRIEKVGPARWLPSLLVRRLESLCLRIE
ncbi:Cytochrome P450 144 [Mycolicibacterium vanbaalenii]|uniref:Cytochrome P450 144 n=1 Tax=Mycolicibacterium vanbaalenii TaxID=110539 RepID=A0A5S9RA82_MYCVN|nr:cytochrome P450 [Mycolicibacterium vanbaalenii]CAA0136383.1 Cytochrome P450 144 [Mycolicibacterium vanbaalenii]